MLLGEIKATLLQILKIIAAAEKAVYLPYEKYFYNKIFIKQGLFQQPPVGPFRDLKQDFYRFLRDRRRPDYFLKCILEWQVEGKTYETVIDPFLAVPCSTKHLLNESDNESSDNSLDEDSDSSIGFAGSDDENVESAKPKQNIDQRLQTIANEDEINIAGNDIHIHFICSLKGVLTFLEDVELICKKEATSNIHSTISDYKKYEVVLTKLSEFNAGLTPGIDDEFYSAMCTGIESAVSNEFQQARISYKSQQVAQSEQVLDLNNLTGIILDEEQVKHVFTLNKAIGLTTRDMNCRPQIPYKTPVATKSSADTETTEDDDQLRPFVRGYTP